MLHARIVSQHGSLYFAAEATPYDLESLRTHVHDFQSSDVKAVRLELSVDEATQGLMEGPITALLRTLAAEGVQVRLIVPPNPSVGAAAKRR
jgi:hypothetical protein